MGTISKLVMPRLVRLVPASTSSLHLPNLEVEVGGVQLGLDDPRQGDRIVGVEVDDRVAMAVVQRRVQGCLRVGENRTAELKRIRARMEVGHRVMTDAGEV